LNTQILKNKLL